MRNPINTYLLQVFKCKMNFVTTNEFSLHKGIPVLHCYSQNAISLGTNTMFHACTEHIDVQYDFIKEVIEGLGSLHKISTRKNHADDH